MKAKMALIEVMKKYTLVRAPETEVSLQTFDFDQILQ